MYNNNLRSQLLVEINDSIFNNNKNLEKKFIQRKPTQIRCQVCTEEQGSRG